MRACDPEGPVMVHITKLYSTTDAQGFRALGRVMSGTLRKGMGVKVLGEGYSPEDEEDMMKTIVEDIWIGEARSVKFTESELALTDSITGTSSQRRKFRQEIWSSSVVSTRLLPRRLRLRKPPLTTTYTSSGRSST
jgi:translation elongation factor EF-G